MDPSAVGVRLASGVVAPLVRKLFVKEGPGAGLVAKPVRISGLVSFKGERRTLSDKDLRKLAAELVDRAVRTAGPGERPLAADEEPAVADALATTLHGLGDLDMDDVQAVRLGATALAARLEAARPHAVRGLSRDAELLHATLLGTACLHIVHFFTQRSAFVARTLVQQSRSLDSLITLIDEFLERHPSPRAADAAFERGYLAYIARKHGRLTIYGIDLAHSPDRWPLDAAYMSLEATAPAAREMTAVGPFVERTDPWDGPPAPAPVPADQALAGRDRVLLRGVAGSGKSTLVQWLAVSCTKAPGETALPHLYGRIPFVLPLRTLARDGAPLPTPDRFLASVGCPVSGSQPDGWADRVLTSGRALLLIDGLDEIPDRERELARRWLRDLTDAFPDNLWLVTSRPSAVRDDWLAADGFGELTLSAMSRSEVAAFIGRWHDAARCDAEDPERLDAYEQSLLAAVHTKQDLARLATNPLMCGLICALHRDRRGYLPTGRKELYDAALGMLLSRRDRERDMAAPTGIELSDEPQIQLLQRLAYWLIRNGRSELDRERAERILGEALPAVPAAAEQGDATAIFRHLLLRSGLLREPAPGAVDFVHRTFQDYLGAKAAVEDGDFGLLVAHAEDSQWEDVIRMAVAHARPRERVEILRGLMERGDGIEGRLTSLRVHLLAMACLEHATEIDPRVRDEVHERARAILPPRRREESNLLAGVGPLVLELLPGPEGLEDDEAQEVVATAALIGSDAALEVMKRFRKHPADGAQHQLALSWPHFDTDTYAREVLQHLDSFVTFTAKSPAELHALRALGRPRVSVSGPFTAAELLGALPLGRIESLSIMENPEISDLSFLREFPSLEWLSLWDCPAVESVVPLAGLQLCTFGISGPPDKNVPIPRGLHRLRHTHTLLLHGTPPPEGLAVLPADAPLSRLTLSRPVGTEFTGITRWPRIRNIQLQRLAHDFGEDQWGALASLSELEHFSFGLAEEVVALHLPDGLQLPQVKTLSIINTARLPVPGMSRLLASTLPAFSGVRKLQLYGVIDGSIDLSPTSVLPELQEIYLSDLRPEPGYSLPPHIKLTRYPRPRT
ncbi:NACHT domain-containing protein [Streptomyces sp. Isolate_219]|uniref:NACHT domain-containing protein n=1 Tax=Streptomyces sp. Isolate_219 TaxID=2950110 RepID=UPI0021CAC57F|nr:NACHT domain-containing protein [Streptomyces sp. Isolate_219]MCR8575645.1 NACHT domain-containing protein [Streptomyces sp. Isolate_219]